jgi:hypothetical protein
VTPAAARGAHEPLEARTVSSSTTGLVAGLLLALVGAVGGFGWLLLAVLLGGVGYALGAHLEGRVDLTSLLPGRRG